MLPFRKLGRPLEASFEASASSGQKYAEIKKAIGLGTHICGSFDDGFLNVAGSTSIRNGGA